MNAEALATNATCIHNELTWFQRFLELRMKLHVGEVRDLKLLETLEPPSLPESGSPYAEVVQRYGMGAAERLVLILSSIPHLRPEALDPFLIQNQALGRRFTEFGGWLGATHTGLIPTVETAMFLLAGDELQARLGFSSLFSQEHLLYREGILSLQHRNPEEPALSATLRLTPEYLERLTTGRAYHAPFSPEFPAQRITTPYEWDDLVLAPSIREELNDIVTWIRHQDSLLEGWMLKKRLKPGYRTLFYGPPGTGKTLTACLLGKATGLTVYRIDLSKMISKYIGETEKNLASLFDRAQHQKWVLFFDEADSLFGKRTESRDANDRAANQQVSYLLQRFEDFPGVVILATNLRSHFDEAFARRFQSMIHFPMPGYEQRLTLWESNFKGKPYHLAPDVDLRKLAREHEIAGGSIINVLRYACLKAIVRNPQEIRTQDLLHGIQKEFSKEGKFPGLSR
jgi:hypothetical protein